MSDVNITVSGQTYSPSSSGLMVPQNYKQQEVHQKRQTSAVEKIVKQNQIAQRTQRKSFLKTAGISFSVASVLKQSQIFTGVIGTIFQLIGALVDVILAPFLPIVIPILKIIGKWIPIIGDTIQGFLDKVIAWLSDNAEDVNKQASMILDSLNENKEKGILSLAMHGKIRGVLARILPKIPIIGPLIKNAIKLKDGVMKVASRIGAKLAPMFTKLSAKLAPMFTKLSTRLAPMFKGLGSAFARQIGRIPGVKSLVAGAKSIGNAVKNVITKIPGVKALTGKVGGLVAKLGVKGAVRAGLSSVPVLGAATEVAYGAYKTVTDFSKTLKHTGDLGKAFGAGATRAGLTAGLAGAAFFDPTGVASTVASFAGHAGLDYMLRKDDYVPTEINVNILGLDDQQKAEVETQDERNNEIKREAHSGGF